MYDFPDVSESSGFIFLAVVNLNNRGDIVGTTDDHYFSFCNVFSQYKITFYRDSLFNTFTAFKL